MTEPSKAASTKRGHLFVLEMITGRMARIGGIRKFRRLAKPVLVPGVGHELTNTDRDRVRKRTEQEAHLRTC